MASVCAFSFAGGLAFYLSDAWPVIGFRVADGLLIYLAFKINYRSGRLVERLHLTRDRLTVIRTWPGGRRQTWEFQPYWLQVVFYERPGDDERANNPLILRSQRQTIPVGRASTSTAHRSRASAQRPAWGGVYRPT